MIKPIETIYNGYRFRSRLEARWAVFFDALDIDYEYEKQGFNLALNAHRVKYLPDFWVPGLKGGSGGWIEIKGTPPAPGSQDDLGPSLLAICSEKPVFVFWGEIEIPHINTIYHCGSTTRGEIYGARWAWSDCPHCHVLGLSYLGKVSLLPCGCYKRHHYTETFEYNAISPRLKAAYTAARQARFEHGETPIPLLKDERQRTEAIAFARDIRHLDSWVTP